MAGKSVNFKTHCNLYESYFEIITKWLSCNGEAWGIGPTAVFASAAALFLYNELESTLFVPGDQTHVSLLEKTLISTMLLGMLALMIHLWVCCMRFFQYYLDTLIKDSPNMLLEMTAGGFLGGKPEMVALGPLTRFLRQQQPQIHITMCWFLSLCYADYVRKNYCQRFNMPYLEQWQSELHQRAVQGVNNTIEKVNSFVGSVHHRLRRFAQTATDNGNLITTPQTHTGISSAKLPPTTIGCADSIALRCDAGPTNFNAPIAQPAKEFAYELVHQPDEAPVDAIENLRKYIMATRCSCDVTQNAGVCSDNTKNETNS